MANINNKDLNRLFKMVVMLQIQMSQIQRMAKNNEENDWSVFGDDAVVRSWREAKSMANRGKLLGTKTIRFMESIGVLPY